MKRREAKAARDGWRRRGDWAAAASACSWQSRPAAPFGMPTVARFRCASGCWGNPHMLVCSIRADQARLSILMLGGQSGGGANFNVVPEECWFTVDRRINPEESLEEERAKLIAVLESCKREGIPLEWEILQEGRSSAWREEEPLGEALARSIRTVTGEPARFEMCPGLLETRFYAAQGVPAYAYGPGLLSVAHGPKEYVDLRKVTDCAAIYALTAMEMLKQ